MQGRLIGLRFQPDGHGGTMVSARVKTSAGRRTWVGLGTAIGEGELEERIAEANRRYPNPATRRMEGRT